MRSKGLKSTIVILSISIVSCVKTTTDCKSYFTNCLDLKLATGSNYKIWDMKISDKKVVIRAFDRNKNYESIFIDLNTRVSQIFKCPNNGFFQSDIMYELFENKLWYTSMSKPDKLYSFTIGSSKLDSLDLKVNDVFPSTQLVNNTSQFFFLGNLYGITVLKNRSQGIVIKNEGITISRGVNTISRPVKNDINLVSGIVSTKNEHTFLALNSSNKIVWKGFVKYRADVDAINIFNVDSVFWIAGENKLIALNKKNGSFFRELRLKNKIVKMYNQGNFLISVSLPGINPFETNLKNQPIVFTVVDLNHFSKIYNYTIFYNGIAKITVIKNNIIIADQRQFRIYDVKTAKLKFNQKLKTDYDDKYTFEAISDWHSNDSYIRTYDDKLYW